jgi:hypothetical protein
MKWKDCLMTILPHSSTIDSFICAMSAIAAIFIVYWEFYVRGVPILLVLCAVSHCLFVAQEYLHLIFPTQ